MNARTTAWMPLLLLALTGCASMNLNAGFSDVSARVEERATAKITWNQGLELDEEIAQRLRSLLQQR